jgi:hypothetical protein
MFPETNVEFNGAFLSVRHALSGQSEEEER